MELKLSGQFKKDLKRYKHNREKLRDLKRILTCLQATGAVPLAYNPHKLIGEYEGCLECHIQNDFLLIWYDKQKPVIKLLRLGTHSELFKKY